MEHPHDMPSSFMATSIHEAASKAKVINPSAVSVHKVAAAAAPPPPPGAAAAVAAAAAAAATATAGNASNVGFAGANINLGLAGGISGAEPPIALARGGDNDNGNDSNNTSNNNGLARGNNNGMSRGGPSHPLLDDHVRLPSSMDLKLQRKPVKYRECLKNHAANLGGHATDGCGEFMPSGEEGSIEALRCAACNCHRNFHRREVEGEPAPCDCVYGPFRDGKRLEPLFPSPLPLPSPTLLHHPRPTGPGGGMPPTPQMIMAFNSQPHPDSDEYDGALISPHSSLKKRFRTKFTTEQKEQMHTFAEKVGWRIQKQDEATVQQFCADIGVKRHVLKVWMHNNKHTLGKKAPGCLTMSEDEMRSS